MSGTLVVQNIQGPSSGANANKIIIPSGQTLDASAGFVPPAGSVIQVIDSSANPIQFNSGTGAEAIRATITKQSNSQVWVQVNGVWGDDGNPFHARFYLQRSTDGGSTWSEPDTLAWYDGTYTFGNYDGNNASNNHLFHYTLKDTVSATSVIYRLVVEGNNNGYTMSVGRRGSSQFGQKTKMILMEIAG
jgi:hypothetical protein